ncbi:MAG: ABC transporter substrate-binding protein [Pseudomonadales bacterium]|nr:ABC transporter substrate-binding protein [Pseudomonadales bacterium]
MVKSIQRIGEFFIALLVVIGVSSGAFAADTSAPDKLISSLFEGVNERLKQDADKIAADRNHLIVIGDELLAPYVSFETMSKQILGKNWRKISPDQRKRYTEAFRQKVSFSVVSQYDPTKKYDMEVTGQRLNDKGDRAAVSSVVTDLSNANKLNISYKLFKSRKTNNWQVYDVVVEGVSVLQSFKTASAEDFKRNGIEYMIAQLQNEKEAPESE